MVRAKGGHNDDGGERELREVTQVALRKLIFLNYLEASTLILSCYNFYITVAC